MNRLYWHKAAGGIPLFYSICMGTKGCHGRSDRNDLIRNKLQWNLNQNSYIFMHENVLENIFWKMAAILSRPQHCSVPSICDLFCTLSVFVELALCAYRTVSQQKLLGGNQWNFNDFVVSTAPADGLIPSSTLASKGTVMNKFGSCVQVELALEWLTLQ